MTKLTVAFLNFAMAPRNCQTGLKVIRRTFTQARKHIHAHKYGGGWGMYRRKHSAKMISYAYFSLQIKNVHKRMLGISYKTMAPIHSY